MKNRIEKSDISYVDLDNRKSACDAVTHLLSLRRQQVATITGSMNMIVGQDRLQGYEDALSENKLPLDETLIVEGDFTEEGGYQRVILGFLVLDKLSGGSFIPDPRQ